ncbi:hypothetical protein BpHYR1_022425 [Brachionus plicatilis]|uniref:Uncharacterized protein n=1 Tax=Brachionus plicatilis TaxID=10195 RepID=A0A3M7T3M0_BRAPC|nr:hypothetical protein BpHYR1_022425 [Brachionus plicatilis]
MKGHPPSTIKETISIHKIGIIKPFIKKNQRKYQYTSNQYSRQNYSIKSEQIRTPNNTRNILVLSDCDKPIYKLENSVFSFWL